MIKKLFNNITSFNKTEVEEPLNRDKIVELIATQVQCLRLPSPVSMEDEAFNDGIDLAVYRIRNMKW